LSDNPDTCPDCDEIQKDLQKERLKRGSIKNDLNTFYNSISDKRASLYAEKYYIIHINWAKRWKEYIEDVQKPKPDFIDNSPLICEHKKFIYVYDIKDSNRDYVPVTSYDWRKLYEEFSSNSPIYVYLNSASDTVTQSFPDICTDCSNLQRVIRESQALTFQDTKLHIVKKQKVSSYSYIRGNDTWIGASHNTTVHELKLYICQALDIDPSEQQLFYNNKELEDDSKELSFYKVTPINPIVYKKKKKSNNSSQMSSSVNLSRSQKETGFEGTILAGRNLQISQKKDEQIKSPPPPSAPQGWPRCKRCTFDNDEKSPTKICSVCEFDNQ